MHIGLLGELEVRDGDGGEIVLTGAKVRALLALLALHAGRTVPTDQLVDALWGEDPPAAVRNGLQALVSKLRRALGATDVVAMRGGGYALDVAPDQVDVHRFEQLVADGRTAAAAGDRDAAIARLRAADALWRGDALAELAYDDVALGAITRLNELRLAALEERIELELALGRHQSATGELEALVALHPLHERLRALLMLALYRGGRQADALRVFQEGRTVLAEELGLDPGPELRRLEAAILAHDPALDAPAEPSVAPPAVRSGSRIPTPRTPLVGRASEVAEVARLLGEQRLVTLVGPGGVGKTRLALEAAAAGDAWLVELAPVGDPASVRGAIAAALDLPDPTQLAAAIGDRDVLVVLDNCEHVITAAADVVDDLLGQCPGLRFLATSRESLRVGGEVVWPVPPLATDDAVQLFVGRARAAGASLVESDDVHAAVADICARLDGLPLAIELAAARTRAFPIPQISARLHDRFRLLTGGARTALPRQQTLRAVVDWSYDLLFDDEQRVFERLSVLPGGCDLATAEAVCADETLDAAELADIVHALVEKSLVVAVPAGDDVRYVQLQTLAEYGREKLADRGDAERSRDAMAAHFARLCARSPSAYIGDDQRRWLEAMDRERDNVRAALEWAVASDDAETALTIAGGAAWPHWLAGTAVEGRRWLDDAFRCAGEASPWVRALASTGRALLHFQVGEPVGVDADFEAALATFGEQGDVAGQALTYSFYAEVAAARGEVDEARRRRCQLLALYDEMPDDGFFVPARAFSRAKLAVLDGDLAAAEEWYRAANEGFGRIDRPVMQSMCLGMVADFDERGGDHAGAAAALGRAVAINDGLGLRGFNGSVLARLGWSLLQLDDVDGAERAYARSLELARQSRHTPVLFLALTGTAVVHRLRGRAEEAVAAATEAIELHRAGARRRLANRVDAESDSLRAAAACFEVLAGVAADRGDGDEAARLTAEVDRLRAEVQIRG